MRLALAVLVLVLSPIAGCLGGDDGDDGPQPGPGSAPPPSVRPAFDQDHDHFDPALHAFSSGIEPLGYHNMAPGTDGASAADRGGWLNSEIIVRGQKAFVGYIGAPWLLGVVDLADPSAPALVGTLETSSAWGMDVAVSDDAAWAFISVYNGAVGTLFSPEYLLQNPQVPDGPALPGVLVADVRDPADPQVSGFLPIHGLGPHTAVYHRYPDGHEVVFANKADAPGGNGIVIANVEATPTDGRTLRPVGLFVLDNDAADGNFPHDLDVQEHALTNATLLYAAYWDAGLVIVDVSDPTSPRLVSRFTEYPDGEEIQIHDVHPFPRLVGGRHYTFSAPEIPGGPTSGHLRIYDTTDPEAPTLVGSWILPGEYVVDSPFLFSTHNFQFLPDGRVALAHGHAGVWVLDWLGPGGDAAPDPAYMRAPVATAYHVPVAPGVSAVEWTPVAGAPWVWGVGIDDRGIVWAADVPSGLYGLRVT